MSDIGVEIEEAEGWVAIAAPQVVLLLRGAGEDPRVASLQAAADGGSLDDVLQILTTGGIGETPDFVGIESGLPVRVVARGEGYAVLSRGEGDPPVRVRATGRAPW